MLNKRCIEIMAYLLDQKRAVTIAQLASHFNVSQRTIRNDLDTADDWLRQLGLQPTQRIPKQGIMLRDNSEELVHRLYGQPSADGYIYTPEERVYVIIGMLLDHRISHAETAKLLDVSGATVSSDLRHVHSWMKKKGLPMHSNPQTGITGPPNEKEIRRGLLLLLSELLDLSTNKHQLIKTRFANIGNILRLYMMDELSDTVDKWRGNIIRWIDMLQKKQKQLLSDDGMCEMFLHLVITLTRIRNGHNVSFTKGEIQFITRRRQNLFAIEFTSTLEKDTGFKLSEDEQLYHALLWMSLRKYRENENVCVDDILLSYDIVRTVKDEIGLDMEEDEEIIARMSSHVSTLFYRMLLRFPERHSQVLDEIKENYPSVFGVVKRKLNSFLASNHLGIGRFGDDEVAYLTMYVIANMFSKSPSAASKKRVLLVCASAIGTSKMLEQRLKRAIADIDIVDSIPYYEFLLRDDFDGVDMIISTVPLENPPLPHVVVSPMLKQEDMPSLMNTLQMEQQNVDVNRYVEAALQIASRSLDLSPEMQLKLSIDLVNQISSELNDTRVAYNITLRDILRQDLVRIYHSADDCYDAIQKAGDLLIKRGLIAQAHVESMKQLKRDLGGYFVVDVGVALPHYLDIGLPGPCLSMIKLNTPVVFGHKANDPVDIVIMLLTNDKTAHLQIIEDLMLILEDDDRMASLRRASTSDELLNILSA